MHTRLLAPALLSLFCVAGCGDPSSQSVSVGMEAVRSAQTMSPQATAEAVFDELRARRISGVMLATMPASKLEEMKSAWAETRRKPISPREAAEFEQMMGMLLADDAEDTLFGMVQPHLAKAQQQASGLAMMAPMMAAKMVEQSGAPDEAGQALGTLGTRLANVDIASESKARSAIRTVIAAAQELDLKDAASVQALDFDGMLGKIDIVYGGLVGVLDTYGLSLDKTLESVQIRELSTTADRASMTMSLELFGAERQTIPFEMERVDGRWMFVDDGDSAPGGVAR